ncbi:hypothetical protein E2C01_084879 [Portunus trituberculatus]|uniref:Uncharacterized protein n=1 Tax=Portunus trituberculatus TaxID=210409 RepID=A0A5B7J7E2_PORTR|nr:hypothetical protein [Portunus trituberculatus]
MKKLISTGSPRFIRIYFIQCPKIGVILIVRIPQNYMVSRKLKFARRFPARQWFTAAHIPLTLAAHHAGSLFTYTWLWQLSYRLYHGYQVPFCISSCDTPKRARKTHTLEERLEVLDRAEKGQRNSVIQAAMGMNEAMSSGGGGGCDGGGGGDGGGDGGGGGGSGSDARTPLSLTLEGEAVQPRDKVYVLGVTLMRIAWLLDGKGLEVLYKAQVRSFILKKV